MTQKLFSSPPNVGLGLQKKKHVAVSLHPVSLMTMLCAGVFLVAATISVFGASYAVTASVPGPIPTSPAVITSPTDGQHFTSADTTFTGSCPAATYVTLFINGSTAGSSWCNAGLTFSILTTLPAGASTAQVQDYNSLNQPGPSSGVITVYYDPPVPPPAPGPGPAPAPSPSPGPAPATPIELRVADVDTNMDYKTINGVPLTTQNPTFLGTAPPFSKIKIEIHSDPVFCYTTTNSTGYWKCRVATKLPPGIHTVAVSAVTKDGKNLSIPTFKILVVEDPQTTPVTAAPATPGLALVLPTYGYQVYSVGQAVPFNFTIAGGRAPYSITVDWRDGRRTTVIQQTAGAISLNHRYAAGDRELMSYEALIRVTDANGSSVVSQAPILIRGNVVPGLGTTQTPPSAFQQFITNMRNWLWLLWPGYLIVGLMLLSFYLGERREHEEERKALLRRTQAVITPHRDRHA